jgi:hypothetical protein
MPETTAVSSPMRLIVTGTKRTVEEASSIVQTPVRFPSSIKAPIGTDTSD